MLAFKKKLSTLLEDFRPIRQIHYCDQDPRPNHTITYRQFGILNHPIKWSCKNGDDGKPTNQCNVFGNFQNNLVEQYQQYRSEMLSNDFLLRKDLKDEARQIIKVVTALTYVQQTNSPIGSIYRAIFLIIM